MKHVPAALGCLLLASAISASLHAQQGAPSASTEAEKSADTSKPKAHKPDAVDLNAITVTTGTRTPKAVDKIPGAITVVSKEEVQHTLTLTEDATAVLARTVPGYAESSQAMSNTGETLRGRIALRLFDGIPQGSPLREGNRAGTFTDMGLIGRIEVINGPSASEGIGASGGIINYISKEPTKEGNETTLITRYSTQGHNDSGSWKVGANFARKQGAYDMLISVAHIDRGISYDGNGRRIGMNTSGSLADSLTDNLFLKGGVNFGTDGEQRLQATISHFKIEGKANYIQVEGCRYDAVSCPVPRTNTSEKGAIFGSKDAFNDFKQYSLSYTHDNLFGGSFKADAYKASQAMRYLPENSSDKQDTLIAPFGTLYDQSEIASEKKGLRASWTRPLLFDVAGLELRTGVDLVEDEAQQRLALTNRLWVPPMDYTSIAPYMQLSYDIGPLTFSGGFRREDGQLKVNDYTTTEYRNRVFVEGGKLDYQANLPNFGAIWRVADGWSLFTSYGKGFSLPNVGIPLRNINKPGQSVKNILDLQPIIVSNTEVGFNWRGDRGSLGGSYYHSKSDYGVSLQIDPTSNDFIMTRAPVDIKGYELSGEFKFSPTWKATGVYSHITGKTTFVNGGPLDKQMGVLDINPDKLAASLAWKFMPNADATLGATKLFSRDLNRGRSGEEHTHGYTLYDLTINYETQRIGKFAFGIENLFNKQYILSWAQLAGYQNYWAGRGRVFSLTHIISF